MTSFVVAIRGQGRRRRVDLCPVEAESAEQAVERVASRLPLVDQRRFSFEAWPRRHPNRNVRVTLAVSRLCRRPDAAAPPRRPRLV